MQSSDAPSKKDDLLKDVGRNLLLFQKIELALKELVSLGSITISSKTGHRSNPFENQSLGLVAAAFIQRHLSENPPVIPESVPHADEITFQSSYHIGGAAAAELAERIRKAIPDRNRLAHRLILDFDLSTDAGLDQARRWLEESHSEQYKLLGVLHDHHRMLRQSFQFLTAFLQSEQGIEEMVLPQLQGASIIQRMLRAVTAPAGLDDWIPVAEAAKGESRSSVGKELERFGKKSLTDLMIASRLFELKAEESPSGGTRMVYRLAPVTSFDPVA